MKRLEELRKSRSLSQKELAQKLNSSQNTISNWETGKREPDFETTIMLADYFNVTTDYLLENDKKNKPSAEAKSYSKDAIDLLDRIDRLSPANRAKLSELIDLYLSAQDKK